MHYSALVILRGQWSRVLILKKVFSFGLYLSIGSRLNLQVFCFEMSNAIFQKQKPHCEVLSFISWMSLLGGNYANSKIFALALLIKNRSFHILMIASKNPSLKGLILDSAIRALF